MRHDLSKKSTRLCPPLKHAGSIAAQPMVPACHNTGSCPNLVMALWQERGASEKTMAIRAEVSGLHTK